MLQATRQVINDASEVVRTQIINARMRTIIGATSVILSMVPKEALAAIPGGTILMASNTARQANRLAGTDALAEGYFKRYNVPIMEDADFHSYVTAFNALDLEPFTRGRPVLDNGRKLIKILIISYLRTHAVVHTGLRASWVLGPMINFQPLEEWFAAYQAEYERAANEAARNSGRLLPQ